ncbi:High mobility group B protein 13 [Camellia lanceoleosa]|uniref:High mobility group B protein 13 n=1 Tax=Camellia lanceoleosa TaxID=1840588 RepID=A0ACC0HRN2_9ERIC|nr:High mobility group B protein 13 [Camellia lanceoleosa]
MEKYLEEMESYKQRKEEESANPKTEEDEMMKIHKLDKKKEKTDSIIKKTKENRQKKKRIVDPNKPKKPASSFLLFSKEARKNLLEERPGINDSTLNALISVKWKELSEEDKQTRIKSQSIRSQDGIGRV